MAKRTLYATLLTMGSLFLMGQAKAAVASIDHCGFTISEPGQYHLTLDLVCPTGDAITVAADDVELHFDGHTLDGAGTGSNGIASFLHNNISIFGTGTIIGFGNTQINLFRVDNSRIVNMTTNNGSGPFGGGSNLQAASNNTVTNCTANNNPYLGIAVGGGSNNTLTSNTVNGNGGSPYGHGGIAVFQSRDNIFLSNTANNNVGGGINVFQSGFTTGNLFQANKANNNSGVDLFDGNPNCGSNTWKSNQNGTANQSCIQ